ncbi:MAG: hypothetical protein JW395_3797 [Nitrospira sp.]|nr:hypothetical protein [Nitrospira sp.]
MSIRATNKEVPVCPECHKPWPMEDMHPIKKLQLAETGSTKVWCVYCHLEKPIKITVKRLYDTEVVT